MRVNLGIKDIILQKYSCSNPPGVIIRVNLAILNVTLSSKLLLGKSKRINLGIKDIKLFSNSTKVKLFKFSRSFNEGQPGDYKCYVLFKTAAGLIQEELHEGQPGD